jgi:hypothetical protein
MVAAERWRELLVLNETPLFFFFQLGKSGFCTNVFVEIHVSYSCSQAK